MVSGSKDQYLGRTKYRFTTKESDEILTLAHSKHVQKIVSALGLDTAKPSAVPGCKLDTKFKGSEELLDDTLATLYRSCVGSAIFLGGDRNEIKFSTKKLSQKMAKPTKGAWARLKRLGRYLKGRPNLARRVQLLEKNPKFLDCHCDTDWAGEEDDEDEKRKSTDGGQIAVGGAVVHAWSSTQPGLPSLSSAEAELRGMVRCAKEALYVQKLFAFMGVDLEIRTSSDSSAAIQAAQRLGAGKMRHLEHSVCGSRSLRKKRESPFIR